MRAVLAVGCACAITVPLGGCDDSRSTLQIHAAASLTDETGIAGIHLYVDGAEFTGEDFGPDLRITLEVPDSGVLRIEMELHQSGTVVSSGGITLALGPDYRWGLDIYRGAEMPGCIGCSVRGFPVLEGWRNEVDENVWLVWAGVRPGVVL